MAQAPRHFRRRISASKERQVMLKLRWVLLAVLYSLANAGIAAEYEYDGNCAESVAHGQKFATNNSIAWTSDSVKTYCFGSSGAKEELLSSTGESVAKADAFWNDPEYWRARVTLREAEQKQSQ